MIAASHSNFLEELNREQRRLATRAQFMILGYVALITVSYVVIDLRFYEAAVLEVWVGFFSWAAGYLLFVGLMEKGGYFAEGRAGGVGTYFALSFVMSIAIALALIVFIVPGLYLLVRWLPAYARALTSEDWIGNNMRWSWAATRPYQVPLAIAMIGPLLCYCLAIIPSFAYEFFEAVPFEVWTIISNAALSVAGAWHTVLGISVFGVIKSGHQTFAASKDAVEPT